MSHFYYAAGVGRIALQSGGARARGRSASREQMAIWDDVLSSDERKIY